MQVTHTFLVKAPDVPTAAAAVHRFLDRTLLVHYDQVQVDPASHCPATDDGFWPRLQMLHVQHLQACRRLVHELAELGLHRLEDLVDLHQGYPSKTLHILAHLLDGFFGIDSAFYNLVEDSHTVSPPLRQAIRQDPTAYRLVSARCSFHSPEEASLIHHGHGDQGL